MPSGEREPPVRGGSLARRLAWTLALASTAAAVFAIATAMLLADRLIVDQAAQSAADAANALAAEVAEEPELAHEIEEEAYELGIAMRVAVMHDGAVVSGDIAIVHRSENDCAIDDRSGELVCRRETAPGSRTFVFAAAPADRVHGHRRPFVIAALAVLAVVMLAAGAGGVVLARRVLGPMRDLQDAVAEMDATTLDSVPLPPPTGLAEIDALRGALASLLARLQAELQRTRTFAANAAHELRTPLTKIRMQLELAAETADAPARPGFERARATATRLQELTEQLLLLATPHHAMNAAQGTSLCALVEGLPEQMEAPRSSRLVIVTPDHDGLVRGDPVLLGAMIGNVVDNALKFSAGPVTVTVRADAPEGRVVVDVDDEGPGVTDSEAAALFQPFARDAAVRSQPGHGLGLALSAHIAEALGGGVAFVHDQPGTTRVRFELPLAR